MTAAASRCLGRMPLHGGWGLLRLSDPDPATATVPGQLLRIHATAGTFTLPLYERHEDALGVLLPPPGHFAATIPARDERATVEMLPTATPAPTGPDEETLVLGIDSGLGGSLALSAWLSKAPALVIVGGRAGVPARPRPSRYLTPNLPAEVIAALPQLEEQGIPSRIALHEWQPGCFDEGPVALLERYLAELPDARRQAIRVYAFTPAGELDASLGALRDALAGVHLVEVPAPA